MRIAEARTARQHVDVPAQRPFQWRSDAEIDATPIRVLRYVETEAETWAGLCRNERRAPKKFK